MNTDNLNRMLRRIGKAALLTELLRAACAGVGALLLAALLAVALDAVVAMAPWGLIAVDALLAAALLAGAGWLAVVAHRNRYNPRRLARLVEKRLDLTDSRLINSVDLAEQTGHSVSDELRQASVARGDRFAAEVSPARVVERAGLRKAALVACVAAVCAITAYVALPGVFQSVIRRYAHPTAGWAPFTLLKFDIRVEPDKVYQGRPATILAALSGPTELPDQANVVFLDDAGQPLHSTPMVPGGAGRFSLPIERATQSRRFYVETPAGRSALGELKVLPVPTFEQVAVRYDFPAYTGWPASVGPLAGNTAIRAIEGTRVTLTVRSNVALREGRLKLTPPDKDQPLGEVTLKPGDDPNTVQGGFTLAANARYAVTLTSAGGVSGNDTFEGTVACVPDAPPDVQITEPDPVVVAPVDWTVKVALAARDDVAVAGISLMRGINGWGPTPTELALERTGPTYATATYEFNLAKLGAKGGDVITYYAAARDNYPSGPHVADTPTFVIRVITTEEYLEFARQKYRIDQMVAELNNLQEQMRKLQETREELTRQFEELNKRIAAGEKLSDADRKKLEELVARQAQYAKQMKDLEAQMRARAAQPQLYEFEQSFRDTLNKMADEMAGNAAKHDELVASYQRRAPSMGKPEAGQQVSSTLAQLHKEGQDDQQGQKGVKTAKQDAEKLRMADELMGLMEQIRAITQQQRELADRLGEFRNKEQLSPAEQMRARRMAQEQADLQQQLNQTLEQMDAKAGAAKGALPKMSASVREFAGAVRQLDVGRDQGNAAVLAQAGEGRYAHQSADSAAKKLESLMGECGNCKGQQQAGADDLDGALGLSKQKLMQSLDQLSQSRQMGESPGMGTNKSGGSGAGQFSTRSRFSLMGPHPQGGQGSSPTENGNTSQVPNPRGDGRGGPGAGAERLAPDTAGRHRPEARGMPGVPARYKNQAEAYFRRLADESK